MGKQPEFLTNLSGRDSCWNDCRDRLNEYHLRHGIRQEYNFVCPVVYLALQLYAINQKYRDRNLFRLKAIEKVVLQFGGGGRGHSESGQRKY